MRKQEIIDKYGKKITEKILENMKGQTVGVNADGSEDYYDYDVVDAYNRINKGNRKK